MKNLNLILMLFLCLSVSILNAQSIKPHTIGIVVSDMDKATAWYQNILELELTKEMAFPEYDSLRINFLTGEHIRLELISKKTSFAIDDHVKDYNINNEPLIGFSKIAFLVPKIEATYERLKKFKVEEVFGITEDKQFNSLFFIIKDLDGNVIQFIEQKTE